MSAELKPRPYRMPEELREALRERSRRSMEMAEAIRRAQQERFERVWGKQ